MANNARSEQNETNLEDSFEHIGKRKTCAKFQQNLLNSMVVGAQSFRRNTWFLKNNLALSKFLCGILHYLNITKYYQIMKKSVHVSQFYINHLSPLNGTLMHI